MAPSKGQKLNCLNLAKKGEIIDELKKGASVTSLSKKYGIAKSTVCYINNKQAQISERIASTYNGPGIRKTLRASEFPETEKTLYKWFLLQRRRNAPVNGTLLKEKARYFFSKFEGRNGRSFHASDGWLQKFKKRFGIRLLKVAGEKLSAMPELVQPFKNKLLESLTSLKLTHEQLYNADETGLYWKLLPDKTFVSASEKSAPGRKTEKQRITVLLCSNATGCHKLRPLVIGRAKEPRSFKNFKIPVDYKNSTSAWMTSFLFKDWFHHKFVPQVRKHLNKKGLPPHGILLIDNAPSHPSENELISDDGKIKAMFLPPNSTAVIQPMDQNVIRLTKLHYKTSLLSLIVTETEETVIKILKQLNLRDAVCLLANAWEKVDRAVIAKCWKPILENNEEFSSEDELPLSVIRSRIPECSTSSATSQVLNLLNAIGPQEYNKTDIEGWINDVIAGEERQEHSDSDNESVCSLPEQHEKRTSQISDTEAIKAFSTALQWAEHKNLNYAEIRMLQNLRERAVLDNVSKTKQMKLTHFFSTDKH